MMTYYGHQFRAARAVTRLSTTTICEGAAMSMRTLQNIEQAERVEYGVRQAGRFEEETIRKVARFYREHGVTFLPAKQRGAGVRYHRPK